MAQVHGKDFAATTNAVDLQDSVRTVSISMTQATAEVTTPSSAAQEFLGGKYGATWSAAGPCDFGTSLQDATLFAQLDGAAIAMAARASDGAIATTNPEYQQNAILTDYTVNFDVAADVNWSAGWQGTAGVTRDTTA